MGKQLVFDTNVCGRIAAAPNQGAVLAKLKAKYRIGASANTILELLQGICRSTGEEHFGVHKQRLRIAIGSSTLASATVLDYPIIHALKRAIGIQSRSRGLNRLKDYVKVVLRARSHHELKTTGVKFPGSQFRRNLKCELVEEDLQRGKDMYSGPLNYAKANDLALATPSTWATNLNQIYRLELREQQVSALAAALDAAYQYQKSVWEMSRTGSFKPEKHENDWIDFNQLFYLADPDILFVTEERRIRERCSRSPQASRVILLPELLLQEGLLLS